MKHTSWIVHSNLCHWKYEEVQTKNLNFKNLSSPAYSSHLSACQVFNSVDLACSLMFDWLSVKCFISWTSTDRNGQLRANIRTFSYTHRIELMHKFNDPIGPKMLKASPKEQKIRKSENVVLTKWKFSIYINRTQKYFLTHPPQK